jgi:hypothetical protein
MTHLAIWKHACVTGIVVLAITTSLSAQTMTLRVPAVAAASGATVDVPIEVAGASKVGALQFEIVYNPELLTAVTARAGALASNSLFDVKTDRPGRLDIGLITTDGVNGSGTLATASFKVTGRSGVTTSLTPGSARAWEGITHHEVLVTPVAGVLTITGAFPWHWILIAVAVVALLLAFILWRRSKRDEKSAPVTTAAAAPARAAPATPPSGGGSFCRHCGKPNPPDSKFCRSCGQPLD